MIKNIYLFILITLSFVTTGITGENMQNSEKLEKAAATAIELLKKHEGFRSYVYKDHEGFDTIGYGFKRNPDETFLESFFRFKTIKEMTKSEADLILKYYVWKNIADLQEIVSLEKDGIIFSDFPLDNMVVFISMRYVLGRKGFLGFEQMIDNIPDANGGSWQGVREEILDSEWHRDPKTKARVEELAGMLKGE